MPLVVQVKVGYVLCVPRFHTATTTTYSLTCVYIIYPLICVLHCRLVFTPITHTPHTHALHHVLAGQWVGIVLLQLVIGVRSCYYRSRLEAGMMMMMMGWDVVDDVDDVDDVLMCHRHLMM